MAERPSYTREQEQVERRRAVVLRVIRVMFLALFITVTLLNILGGLDPKNSDAGSEARAKIWPLTLSVAVTLAAVVLLIDVFTPRKKISTLFSVFLGLMGAMIASLAVSAVVDLLAKSYSIQNENLLALVKVLFGIGLAYLAITTVLQTQDDFRLVIPYVEFTKQVRGPRPMVLDTSVLIDGRFLQLADTGIITSPVVIPQFVVEELQALADSQDKLKRAKGRRGLTNVERLRSSSAADVSIENANIQPMATDQMLLELARSMPAVIVTTDSGLAKVAQIQQVEVLNLHEIASAMRPSLSPGDTITIRLVRPGEHAGQAVGFLEDGTMVVVDGGSPLIGGEAPVTVASMIQTAAGRMVFARAGGAPQNDTPPQPPAAAASTVDAGAAPEPAPSARTAAAAATPPPPAPKPAGTGFLTESQPDLGDGPVEGLGPPRNPFPTNPPRSIRGTSPRNPRR